MIPINFLIKADAQKPFDKYDRRDVNIITMGCSKNLVDSEQLAFQLEQNGFDVFLESTAFCSITIVNTCGFIHDAKEESVLKILECIDSKKKREIDTLIVYGCLSARYMEDLKKELPEVDAFFSVDAIPAILNFLGKEVFPNQLSHRLLSSPPYPSAYLKISEGCSHNCAFCSIPAIRGKQVSKPIPTLIEEANILVQEGVKELILVAQDLTHYGYDINKKHQLYNLLDALAQIDGFEWIRLHYAYPNSFDLNLLDLMGRYPSICHYLDMPIQHINDEILTAMNRKITGDEIRRLLDKIKNKVPDIALRTTLIVGFPGETKKQYKELEDFVSQGYFDRMGVFTYSHEENTLAYRLKDTIANREKCRRMEALMDIQEEISLGKNKQKVGQTFKVLIYGLEGESYYIGRTQYDSVDVDNTVLIPTENKKLKVGEFYQTKIIDADCYELFGEVF